MAITFTCACGAAFVLPDALAGQRGRCPGCDVPLKAPDLPRQADEAPPADEPRYAVVRVDCSCGRRVTAPALRLRSGQARCPSCDRTLSPG